MWAVIKKKSGTQNKRVPQREWYNVAQNMINFEYIQTMIDRREIIDQRHTFTAMFTIWKTMLKNSIF